MSMLPWRKYDFPKPKISRRDPNPNFAVFATIAGILFLTGACFAWPYVRSGIHRAPQAAELSVNHRPSVAGNDVDDFLVHQHNLQRLIAFQKHACGHKDTVDVIGQFLIAVIDDVVRWHVSVFLTGPKGGQGRRPQAFRKRQNMAAIMQQHSAFKT